MKAKEIFLIVATLIVVLILIGIFAGEKTGPQEIDRKIISPEQVSVMESIQEKDAFWAIITSISPDGLLFKKDTEEEIALLMSEHFNSFGYIIEENSDQLEFVLYKRASLEIGDRILIDLDSEGKIISLLKNISKDE